MKRKNILFGACVICIIVWIVIGIVTRISQCMDCAAFPTQTQPTQPVVSQTFDDVPDACDITQE